MTRQLVIVGLAVLVTVVGALLLWQFRVVVVYVLFSLALAAAMRPLAKRLSGRSLLRRLGLILLTLLVVGAVGLGLALSVTAAASEIQQLGTQLAAQDSWRSPVWLSGTPAQELLDEYLPAPDEVFTAITGDEGQLVLPALLGVTQNIIGLISAGAIILFLSLYWSIDQIHFERLWLSLLPAGRRAQVRGIWRTIEPDLGAYIRNEAAQSLLGGLLLGLGYWAMGSPYPALLGLFGAGALLVPLVGSILVVLSALVIGLLTSVWLGVLSALYAVGVLLVLKLWVEPRLFRRVHYNPILTIVILIALADAFGFIGLVVAPPLSAAVQILWSRLVGRRGIGGPTADLSELREREAAVRAAIETMDEPPPLLTSSLERLDRLLAEAEGVRVGQ